ncbi:MAG TPA: hypothetical protein PLJ60_17195 [Chryseolinea sp.]|nr:hypothetical protein [Chryseolinea sp.]
MGGGRYYWPNSICPYIIRSKTFILRPLQSKAPGRIGYDMYWIDAKIIDELKRK